jgi:3-hydroxy-3-methylglutaryl CoA synthase
MAVAAGLDCLAAKDRKSVDGVFFASTTMPFADRLNAGIISAALNVPESGVMCADFGSCLKAGTTAALAAVRSVKSGDLDNVLGAAADQRQAKMGTLAERFIGDGAAALLFGREDVLAEFTGSYSMSCDFIDHYRGSGHEFDYLWRSAG